MNVLANACGGTGRDGARQALREANPSPARLAAALEATRCSGTRRKPRPSTLMTHSVWVWARPPGWPRRTDRLAFSASRGNRDVQRGERSHRECREAPSSSGATGLRADAGATVALDLPLDRSSPQPLMASPHSQPSAAQLAPLETHGAASGASLWKGASRPRARCPKTRCPHAVAATGLRCRILRAAPLAQSTHVAFRSPVR